MENKILNVPVTSEEQRNELIKQLQEMEFKKPLPSSWDEYIKKHCEDQPIHTREVAELLEGLLPIKYSAMYKLEKLMEVYNDGWKPDWSSSDDKYVIYAYKNSIIIYSLCSSNKLLCFKNQEARDLFLKNFEPLIKQYFEID